MTQAQPQPMSSEEKARLKKQWTDLAIQQALSSQWENAVVTNRNILNIYPTDHEALNRLGKAYSELGHYTEARQAYTQTLKYSPGNTIAKKNLDRLALLQEESTKTHIGAERIDPRLFIEETGKTGTTELINIAHASVLAKVGVGDKVQLSVVGHTIQVKNALGEEIGRIEPRLANRLISFIEGGNRYAAAILAMEQGQVRLIIREEYQHPSMFGKVSFISQGGGDTIRAYTKDSMLRYDRDDDDEMGSDDEYYDGGDEADELTEIDFENTNETEE
ncbi:MAG TPA: tetratricopeptide repeat protein [Ktedonobacteraceae bacterium]|nr:tetratricopeptide repeat protein [Ktedonobacteraceae bacterium]